MLIAKYAVLGDAYNLSESDDFHKQWLYRSAKSALGGCCSDVAKSMLYMMFMLFLCAQSLVEE